MLDGYNILKYTGAQGPSINRDSYGISVHTPEGCVKPVPSQVVSLDKLYRHKEKHGKLAGPLYFFNTWQNYQAYRGFADQETFSGPYAGLVTAFTRGSEYRERYGHLWDGTNVVPIFAAEDERVKVTARQFGQDFFGYNYSTNAAINIVPEVGQGDNSLMPLCFAPTNTAINVFNLEGPLARLFSLFGNAAERLNSANPGLISTTADVYNLLNVTVFELHDLLRGYLEPTN